METGQVSICYYQEHGATVWFASGNGYVHGVFLRWLRRQSLGVTHWNTRGWSGWTFIDPKAEQIMLRRFGGFVFRMHWYGPWDDGYEDD